jgi:hypothetical protein
LINELWENKKFVTVLKVLGDESNLVGDIEHRDDENLPARRDAQAKQLFE